MLPTRSKGLLFWPRRPGKRDRPQEGGFGVCEGLLPAELLSGDLTWSWSEKGFFSVAPVVGHTLPSESDVTHPCLFTEWPPVSSTGGSFVVFAKFRNPGDGSHRLTQAATPAGSPGPVSWSRSPAFT